MEPAAVSTWTLAVQWQQPGALLRCVSQVDRTEGEAMLATCGQVGGGAWRLGAHALGLRLYLTSPHHILLHTGLGAGGW